MASVLEMKHAARLLTSIALAARALVAQEPPAQDFGRAYVTIPYSELRALWEAGHDKPQPPREPEAPPVAALVHRADLRLQFSDAGGVLDAEFDVEMLGTQWQTIPLLGGDVRLDKADAGERSVIWKDGYALLTNTAGKTPIALHLATRGAKQMAFPLKLNLCSASVKRLTVTGVPAGLEVRVNGQAAAAMKDGMAVFHLPGDAGEVSIELGAPKKIEAERPITASHWRTQSEVLVRFAEGRLRFLSRLFAQADDGSGLEMAVEVPANAAGVTVVGEDLADWSQTRADDGRRILRVRWKTRDVLDRELAVTYAVPQSPLAEEWTLQGPLAADGGEARHLFAILPADGLELKGEGLRAAVESRRLPEWMRADIGGAVFVTAESASTLALQTHWLPWIATAEAIVSEVKAQLRLVADGATQAAVTFAIKHQAPLAWRLELPAEVELLSCSVGGTAAHPILRGDGAIEIPLPVPDKGVSNVTLVYTAKAKALDPVSGEIALELPRTPLFIERIDWSITIPAAFEVTTFDSNGFVANQAVEGPRDEPGVALRKDFCRGERPVVALFYQRRTLEK